MIPVHKSVQVNLILRLREYILEYYSVFYKMVKSVCNVTEFTKSMLYNCIKVVRLNLTNLTSGYGPAVS